MIDYERLDAPAQVAHYEDVVRIFRSRCQSMRQAQVAGIAIALLAPGWWKLAGLFVYWKWGTPNMFRNDPCRKDLPMSEERLQYWRGKL